MPLVVAQPPRRLLLRVGAAPLRLVRRICELPMSGKPRLVPVKFTREPLPDARTRLVMVRAARPVLPGVAVMVLFPPRTVTVPRVSVTVSPWIPVRVMVPPRVLMALPARMRSARLAGAELKAVPALSMFTAPNSRFRPAVLARVALSRSWRVPPRTLVAPV